MRLTEVTVHSLSSPIEPPQERAFYGGVRRLHKRDFVLIVVETADGTVGYAPGAATSSAMREYFEGTSHDDFADLMETRVADAIAAIEITSPTDIARTVRELALPTKMESEAIGALDVAYHDIRGKEVGAPVYELLTDHDIGSVSLDCYASAGMYMDPPEYAEQARAIQERGFSAYKYRPAGPPETDREVIRQIRETVGDDLDVMVDAHTWWKLGERSYSFEQVVGVIESIASENPYWVEEPVAPMDYDAYERLCERVAVPVAGGESEASPEGLCRLAETGIRYLQGDVRHHAGFTGCWRAVEACSGRDVTFVPHNFGTQLGLVANAHLMVAQPETSLLEYPVFGDDTAGMYPFPLAEEVVADDLSIEDGAFEVPDGPGLGIEINEDVIEEYPAIEGPWTEFEYEDG
ncbi:MAG TPA: mandelate racemase/muconate lactonizing enzyme family protein [Halococcus sp.]|nr:mandelate racemase/muconate lactonizing enzyme family protein [Halococcus sp.]